MAQVHPGRFTAAGDADVTVFLIGMRFNRWWRIDRWWSVFTAMPPMIRALASDPDLGMTGYHLWFGRTTILLSYWRSPEDLQRFAAAPDQPHLAPWRDYMRRIGSSGDVGVWHETYRTRPTDREVIYSNMPRFGLAKALDHVPIGRGTGTARERIGRA